MDNLKISHKNFPKEYNLWNSIKQRCYNKKNKSYKNYGYRGIRMCKTWKNSFEQFYKDMGPKPSDKHSIERINNNWYYCKENCKWATRKEQSRNKRTNTIITFRGENKSLVEWAEFFGINPSTVGTRLFRGIPIEEVFNKDHREIDKTAIEFNGKTQSLYKWSKELGVQRQTLYSRIYRMGWSIEKALTTPIQRHVRSRKSDEP